MVNSPSLCEYTEAKVYECKFLYGLSFQIFKKISINL